MRSSYQCAKPVELTIKGKIGMLQMGISKRILNGNLDDTRYKFRNQNIDKMVFTQHGLFVKYDAPEFGLKSLHGELMQGLLNIGLDFWVELPPQVTLTKGRNNIVGDESAPVLDSMYKAFESVFLDVILADEELLYSASNGLFHLLAKTFDSHYASLARERERLRYGTMRRIVSRAAFIGSKSIDVGDYIFKGISRGAALMGKGAGILARRTPVLLEEMVDALKTNRELRFKVMKVAGEGTGLLAAVLGAGYGLYEVHDHYGWAPFINTGLAAAGGLAVAGMGRLTHKIYTETLPSWARWARENSLPDIQSTVNQASTTISDPVPDDDRSTLEIILGLARNVKRTAQRAYTSLKIYMNKDLDGVGDMFLHSTGLYQNMEERREKARCKQRNKVARKYLSDLAKDQFLRQIMAKKIIPALYTSILLGESETQKQAGYVPRSIFREVVRDFFSIDFPDPLDVRGNSSQRGRPADADSFTSLQQYQVKISINELVDLCLQGKIRHAQEHNGNGGINFRYLPEDTFWIDVDNPMVSVVMQKLKGLREDIQNTYDIKLLEDHLENISEVAIGTALFLYLASGVGMIHFLVAAKKNYKDPFLNQSWHRHVEHVGALLQTPLPTPKSILPYLRIGWEKTSSSVSIFAEIAGLFAQDAYAKILLPAAKKFNPERYPQYAAATASKLENILSTLHTWGEEVGKDWKRKKEEKRQRQLSKGLSKGKRENKIDANTKKPSRLTALYADAKDAVLTFYRNTGLYFLLGDGTGSRSTSGSFDGLGKSRLRTIVETANTGQGYLELMNVVEGIDRLVCDATKAKPFEFQFGWHLFDSALAGGINVTPKRIVHIDLDKFAGLLYGLVPRGDGHTHSHYPTQAAYTLLEHLLHLHTHDVFKSYDHVQQNSRYDKGTHPLAFLEKQNGLRQSVIDYMFRHELDLVTHMQRFYLPERGLCPNYYISPGELVYLALRTRRGLVEYRKNSERAREV